jgi:hypothetical protein
MTLDQFIREHTIQAPGLKTLYSHFCEAFRRSLPEADRAQWPKPAIGKALDSLGIPRGIASNGRWHVGNLALREDCEAYRRTGNRLTRAM